MAARTHDSSAHGLLFAQASGNQDRRSGLGHDLQLTADLTAMSCNPGGRLKTIEESASES
jgi:hypothetical protein